MLDNYKNGQPLLYNILNNAIINNKLSHAYLFDSNGNCEVCEIVLSFVKMIITRDILDQKVKDNICMRIDNNNYVDVKIIEPDGMWIKKEQLLDLQSEFSKKSIEGNKKVYVIKSADKMNVQTANSILKFLEEPVDDIIAILIVDNINLIIPTILSRCQIIKLNKNNITQSSIDNFSSYFYQGKYATLLDSDKSNIIENVINFIMYLENYGLNTIIYSKKYWHNNFKDREISILAINLCIYFYYDVIKYKSNVSNYFFGDRVSDIVYTAEKNSYEEIIKKIEVLNKIENYLKRNLNMNLLFDKMVIDMCGDVDENSKC